MKTFLATCAVCGSGEPADYGIRHGIETLTCTQCGAQRQHLPVTLDLEAWYRDEYFTPGAGWARYTHTYDHDVAVAKLRWEAYALPLTARVLDVGCGNNAFVNVGRERGHDAWGQDLALSAYGPHTYVGTLPDVAFPTASFDVVTCHDVLEHVADPNVYLNEMARVLRPGGRLLLDFPRFHHPAGVHHWKPVEHLWMLTEEELVALVQRAGFRDAVVTHPIPSKVLIAATRRDVTRPSILVPAGIGDAYWVLVKLRAFLRERGLGEMANVYVQDQGGPKRTQPFLDTIPFIRAAGYVETPRSGNFGAVWNEAYMQNGRTVYPGVGGCDYFLAYNGVLRHGRSLDAVDPQWAPEWEMPMFVSKAQWAMRARCTAGGPYVVAYFVSSGMYRQWLNEFPYERILATLDLFRARGFRIVFLGAEWDRDSVGMRLARARPADLGWVNCIGETTYDEMAGLLRGAAGVVGWPSGATLLPPTWRVPTALVWNRYFKEAFWAHAVMPGSPYRAVDSSRLTPERLADALEAVRSGAR